ncbi:MAG: UV DNA damage repair endonuclease UvsE [Actinobacteria bacterium]|nr:UV DNA damage repair endonuclease UvsE [Actinomycetota bacterium]
MERRYGYCCINLSLAKEKISTNRGMVKKTFLEKGIAYASELALKNVLDLRHILEWNDDNNIRMFRMSSDIFPWCSEYEISDLPDYQAILEILKSCGDFAKRTDQRITFHPSPYGVLASVNPSVVTKAIKELNQHGEIFDLMGLDRNLFYPINIHVNTTQPSKEEAAGRFCLNFQRLSDSVKKRLVVEVDDKKSQYTSVDLFHLIYKPLGIPITFDYLHNRCNPSQYSEEEALALCLSTWPEKIPAITHYSDSKKLYEDESSKEVAHTDWVWGKVETYGLNFDIEFEVKMKDLALLKFLEENKKLLNYEREYTEL